MNLFDAIFTHDDSAPAIRFDHRELTYGELRAETLRMAQAIVSLGAVRGDRVRLAADQARELLAALLAGTGAAVALAVAVAVIRRPSGQRTAA